MKKFFYKFFEIQGICLDIVLVIAVVFLLSFQSVSIRSEKM